MSALYFTDRDKESGIDSDNDSGTETPNSNDYLTSTSMNSIQITPNSSSISAGEDINSQPSSEASQVIMSAV